jgi:hypothetical protein
MALVCTANYLEDIEGLFRHYKKLADAAIAQASDEHLYALLDPDANSIAIVIQHLAGNMKSRWTDFLGSDGEKPWRDRDREFVHPPSTRAALLAYWEEGWACLFGELGSLTEQDLACIVTIRGERHTVLQAVQRQVTHCSYHCGQVVLLAKHFQHAQWKPLTVPRGKSAEFNARVAAGELSQR